VPGRKGRPRERCRAKGVSTGRIAPGGDVYILGAGMIKLGKNYEDNIKKMTGESCRGDLDDCRPGREALSHVNSRACGIVP